MMGLLLAGACGGGRGAKGPEARPDHPGALHWYPLDAGMQWVFTVRDIELDQGMMSIAKVATASGDTVTLRTGNDTTTLRVAPDGIVREPAGGYLLRTPPRLGDKWPAAEGANVEVVEVDAHVTVEAGSFQGCAKTRERFPDGSTIERTFCPEVGPVLIAASAMTEQGSLASTTARLRSYGMPQDLGAEGRTSTK